VCGTAKQLSLSSTMAWISASFCSLAPSFLRNALESGIGRWLKVETVCWGRHRVGSLRSRKMFRVPEMFIVRCEMLKCQKCGGRRVE
jgi:hypothetical protein